jgi:hypothetical protein
MAVNVVSIDHFGGDFPSDLSRKKKVALRDPENSTV